MTCRVIRRHGVVTIAPFGFTFLASCCKEIVRQARARDMQRLPSVVFSLDDPKAAYRQVPMIDPQMCIVCMYSFDAHDPGPAYSGLKDLRLYSSTGPRPDSSSRPYA